MKKWLKRIGLSLLALMVILGIAAAAFMWYQNSQKFVSVLVFSKTESFRHESIEAGRQAIFEMGEKHGFTVDTTEDASLFTEKQLQKYNVVVFLNTTGNVLNDAQQLEFNRFIQAGGGFVGIHAAADTEYDWPWYGKLVGAYFNGHPNDPNVREADIQVVNKDHVCTNMLPDVWHRTDEWYNYKDINPAINVLMNLDESSYEGGTNGENHPIAWYHEYDGGRSWYTGSGHTDETFEEELFLAHLKEGIEWAAGPKTAVNYNNANVAPEENRFTKVILETNLNEPMELELLPNGNILFVERGGNVKLFDLEADSSTVIQKIQVSNKHEDGLLGVALDPNFKDNKWLYLFYSDPEKSHQNVSRFKMNDALDAIDMTSEKVLLTIATQRDECCHSAGSLEFGPDGLLFIAVGDNTNPHGSDGFSPSDEQEGRSPWDAQKSSANTNDLRGKVLRIKPEADGTYSIPEGNLFANADQGRPEIYVMGCRNPFRISIDQRKGYLYWGDVGPDSGSDSLGRGPMGYDEVNQAKEAGFFGWPYFIGNNRAYNKYNFATKVSSEPFNPEKPINTSPNNTGAKELPPAKPAYIYYPYDESRDFPLVGSGGRNAMAGPVFYVDEYEESDGRFPGYYDNKLFIYEWMRGWIMAVTQDEDGNLKRMERFLPSLHLDNPTDMVFSPKGDLYMLEYGKIWFNGSPEARLFKIEYTGSNRKPVAVIDQDKTVGAAPLTIVFNSDKTKDFDGDDLKYAWYFEEDGKVSSTEANPSYTFKNPGEYKVKLVVTDPEGLVSESKVDVLVGNELPEIDWALKGNQSFYFEDTPVAYEVSVKDKEDGAIGSGIDASAVSISIDYLERGFDANEVALGHKALQEASQFGLGENLIKKSDCNACHQEKQKSVGPSYVDVAEKYKGDMKAPNYLADRIIAGGGGVWGETVMAAHPALSKSEALQMAKYILSIGGDGTAKTLASNGTFSFKEHKKEHTEGRYIFTASYKDKGGTGVGPLTAQKVISLRAPVVPSYEAKTFVNAQRFVVTPEMSNGLLEEELTMMIPNKEAELMYENLDLTGIKQIKMDLLKAGAFMSGGTFEIRIDSADGPVIASDEIKIKLTDMGPGSVSTSVKATEGKHDLYVLFNNDGEKPVAGLVNLQFSQDGVLK